VCVCFLDALGRVRLIPICTQVAYQTGKAEHATGHEFGTIVVRDDAALSANGAVESKESVSPLQLYFTAGKRSRQPREDDKSASFKHAATSDEHYTLTATVDEGARNLAIAYSIKSTTQLSPVNHIPHFYSSDAVMDRIVHHFVPSPDSSKRAAKTNIPAMVCAGLSVCVCVCADSLLRQVLYQAARNAQFRQEENPLYDASQTEARRNQFAIAVMHLMARAGAMPEPNMTASATFASAYLAALQEVTGWQVKSSRHVQYVSLACVPWWRNSCARVQDDLSECSDSHRIGRLARSRHGNGVSSRCWRTLFSGTI
jgi:hypothetical protein